MKLGVVSDTHGHVPNTRAAVNMLAAFEVDVVLHCGDIGAADIVPLFESWPTHFVLGNVDYGSKDLVEEIGRCGQHHHGRFGQLELADVRIAWLHGDDSRLLEQTIRSGEHQLVCHGHTHVAEQRLVGKTIVLNPGALYRARRHTIAVVSLPSLEIESLEVL